MGEPGLAIKSPSCPPIANSLSLATTQALLVIKKNTSFCLNEGMIFHTYPKQISNMIYAFPLQTSKHK